MAHHRRGRLHRQQPARKTAQAQPTPWLNFCWKKAISCTAWRGCSVFTQSSVLRPQHSPRYIERKEPEILSHLELVANTVRMEEACFQSGNQLVKLLFFGLISGERAEIRAEVGVLSAERTAAVHKVVSVFAYRKIKLSRHGWFPLLTAWM